MLSVNTPFNNVVGLDSGMNSVIILLYSSRVQEQLCCAVLFMVEEEEASYWVTFIVWVTKSLCSIALTLELIIVVTMMMSVLVVKVRNIRVVRLPSLSLTLKSN